MLNLRFMLAFLPLAIPMLARPQANPPITGPLTVSSDSRYFKDAGGKRLLLSGSQTWNTLQDWGTDGSAQSLDFAAFEIGRAHV